MLVKPLLEMQSVSATQYEP